MQFEKLNQIVKNKIHSLPNELALTTMGIHTALMRDEYIRDLFEIELPSVENISSTIEVKNGTVYAVRMDTTYGVVGFKKPVIASLILKRIIESVRRGQFNNRWIDGGNVNSALALAYYARKFHGKAAYVMSHLFPDYVLEYIREHSQDAIEIVKAPEQGLGVERDFYKYLVTLTRNDKHYKNYIPLWHAKYSGEYTRVLGEELAHGLSFVPDYIVVSVGAGSTLEGQALPLKRKFNNIPKIVVPEHSKSPLLHFSEPPSRLINKVCSDNEASTFFNKPPVGIPHLVIGPHYDELNPLIKRNVLDEIDGVFRYDDFDWQQMAYNCLNRGLAIGNSSAANLVIAKHLASRGKTVLTFIYEPFRSFYGAEYLTNVIHNHHELK